MLRQESHSIGFNFCLIIPWPTEKYAEWLSAVEIARAMTMAHSFLTVDAVRDGVHAYSEDLLDIVLQEVDKPIGVCGFVQPNNVQ